MVAVNLIFITSSSNGSFFFGNYTQFLFRLLENINYVILRWSCTAFQSHRSLWGASRTAASGRGRPLPLQAYLPLLLPCSNFIRNNPFKWKYKVLVLTSDFLLTLLKNVLLTNHIQGIKIFWLGVFLDFGLNNHWSNSVIRVEKEEQEVWALLCLLPWLLFIHLRVLQISKKK